MSDRSHESTREPSGGSDRDPPGDRHPDVAREILHTLRARLDEHFHLAVLREGEEINCASGCHECCHARFGVFDLEAAKIRQALAGLPRPVRDRIRAQATDPNAQGHCALLLDGRCSVYHERPLICRAHGLPLAIEVEPTEGDDSGAPTPAGVQVSWCPRNFRGAAPDPATVLRVAALDEPLAMGAQLWDGRGHRTPLAQLAAEADPAPTA